MNQQKPQIPPWAQGPFEIIQHADKHIKLEGDADRRIALIGFDNAIEICIDVFITLHPKARGIEISKNNIEKAQVNYHTKLEFFYNYVKVIDNQVDIPIEHVVWYHQLRNELYHSGNGLVPEIKAVLGAQAAAYYIFSTLFKTNISPSTESESFLERISRPIIDSINIDEILRKQGHLLIYQDKYRPTRFFRVCALPIGGFGVQLVEWDLTKRIWSIITSFPRKGMNLDKVRDFLSRSGFVEYEGELPQPIIL